MINWIGILSVCFSEPPPFLSAAYFAILLWARFLTGCLGTSISSRLLLYCYSQAESALYCSIRFLLCACVLESCYDTWELATVFFFIYGCCLSALVLNLLCLLIVPFWEFWTTSGCSNLTLLLWLSLLNCWIDLLLFRLVAAFLRRICC